MYASRFGFDQMNIHIMYTIALGGVTDGLPGGRREGGEAPSEKLKKTNGMTKTTRKKHGRLTRPKKIKTPAERRQAPLRLRGGVGLTVPRALARPLPL